MPELRKHRHKTKTMIKNYFKIAWRHLLKDRITSTINILGLALSLAATILIGLYIHHELSYEKGFDTEDQLCRVYRHYENPDKGWVHFLPSGVCTWIVVFLRQCLFYLKWAIQLVP